MNKVIVIVVLLALILAVPFAKRNATAFGQIGLLPIPELEYRDDTLIIKHDDGGAMVDYMLRYTEMRKDEKFLAIDGECDSSCTLFFGYISRHNICITPKAKLGFHRSNRPEGTTVMLMNYPPPVLMWIMGEGITEDIKYLPDDLLHAMFETCPEDFINPPPPPPGSEKID